MRLRLSAVSAEQWIFMAPVGRSFFDGRRMRTITREQAEEIVANTREAMRFFKANARGQTPYTFPVKTDHQGPERNGDLLEVKLAGEGDLFGFYGRVRWNKDAQRAVEARRLQHVSIGIGSGYDLDDGTRLGPLVDEVSVTATPRITSIGTIQDTLTLRLSRGTLSEEKVEEIVKLLNQLIENQNAQATMIGDLASVIENATGEEPEDAPEPPDVENSKDGDEEPAPVENSKDGEDDETRASIAALVKLVQDSTKEQQEVRASITALESRLARLNLSQRGNAPTQPKPGPVTRESRKAELLAQGVDPLEVIRKLHSEGF